jgi:hypothetical protein
MQNEDTPVSIDSVKHGVYIVSLHQSRPIFWLLFFWKDLGCALPLCYMHEAVEGVRWAERGVGGGSDITAVWGGRI